MNISLFPSVYSMEEPLKQFLLSCVNSYLWKSAGQKGKRQLVPYRNYHSIANCRTKIPAIFRRIFGVFLSYSDIFMSYSTISRGTPHFLTTLVQPLVHRELVFAPVLTLHQVSIAAAYRPTKLDAYSE